jgi:hypothetical protein
LDLVDELYIAPMMISTPNTITRYGNIVVSHMVEKSQPKKYANPLMIMIEPNMTPQIASPNGSPKHSSSGFFGALVAGGGASA